MKVVVSKRDGGLCVSCLSMNIGEYSMEAGRAIACISTLRLKCVPAASAIKGKRQTRRDDKTIRLSALIVRSCLGKIA